MEINILLYLLPLQNEIISIGSGPKEQQEYSIPALSVVTLPMEDMADACLARMVKAITTHNLTPDSKEFSSEYIPRETCPF